MYDELYKIWKQELEGPEIGKLPTDFYSGIADYLRRLKEEGRMLDKRTVKARLLKRETRNVKRMVRQLIKVRYRKLIRMADKDKKVPSGFLTVEEERIYTGVLPFAEALRSFAKDILRGCVPNVGVKQERRRIVLRFLKDVPAIVGADMKTYGPFKVEDVASLPVENAKILVKRALAENVEV